MRKWGFEWATVGLVAFYGGAVDALAKGSDEDDCPKRVIEGYLGEGTGVDSLPDVAAHLPRGSAIQVPAKGLEESGIRTKILAVVGGAEKTGPEWDPSPASVSMALQNAVRLAARQGFSRIAVGFLARGHFLKLMQASKLELAEAIVTALAETLPRTGAKVVLVVSGTAEQHYFRKVLEAHEVPQVEIVIGSLRNGKTHGCSVIVESVGMEVGAAEGD